MKLLLTSAGIKNPSIHDALLELLGRPIAESDALCIPTASYGHPMAGPGRAWDFIAGHEPRCPMCELGWKSVGVLELTALPSIGRERWVGLSAGSMVMTPRIGEDFVRWKPPAGGDETLGVVDFSICPHLAPEGEPGNTMAEAESWAAEIGGPAYAIDDQTAIKVVDGTVEVISEGHWKLLR